MSRSYKKTPYSGDKKSKYFKRYYNHKVRKIPIDYVFNNGTYKKFGCSWNICDYKTVGTSYEEFKQYVDGATYQDYLKYYIRK